jgi:predicted dehydrogenase
MGPLLRTGEGQGEDEYAMLNVAIVGAGGMGRRHAASFRETGEARLAAVIDPDREAAAALAGEQARVCATLEEALGECDVDAVDVCAPTPFHAALAVQALKAGKHLLLEKPMARTLEECDAIIEAARGSGRTAMVAHVLRFFPEFVRGKEAVDAGLVGEPAVVRTSRGGGMPRGQDSWYRDIAQSGGVVLDLIIHDFDWLRWVLGPAERVYARGLAHSGRDGQDYALVTIRFRSGAIAHVEGTWMRPAGFETRYEIAGTQGLLDFSSRDSATLRVSRFAAAGTRPAVEVPESPLAESPYTAQIRHFLHCVRTGEPPKVSLEDARAAVEIALGALESMRTGEPVALRYQES